MPANIDVNKPQPGTAATAAQRANWLETKTWLDIFIGLFGLDTSNPTPPNEVYAGPISTPAAPSGFRHLVDADLPQGYDYHAPLAGDTYTLSQQNTILDPAGTLATLTLLMPALPTDGAIWSVATSKALTALTITPNTAQVLSNPPTGLGAGGSFAMKYRTANTTWYRWR